MTYIKRIHKHTTSILKCAVLVLSVTLTATLQAESYDNTQIQCIAQNAYHEARGQGEKGMLATIFVVLNRTKDSRFPSTPCKVIAQPNQFVWYGKGKTIKEPEMYDKAKQLVHEVLGGKHKDNTQGALYFNSLHRKPNGTVCTIRIGGHSFYKPVK